MPRSPLYAVFVGPKAAFNSAPKDNVMLMLTEVTVSINVLNLFGAILQDERIVIDQEVANVPPTTQTAVLAQGDNLSPLVFSILLKGPLIK